MAQQRICIIGFSNSTRDLAPTDDSWEYWGMNHLYPHVERPWSRWFEMHPFSWIRAREHKWRGYVEWLRNRPFPVMMLDESVDVPYAVSYPLAEIRQDLNWPALMEEDYFASTPAYAFAYAMMLKPERIAVYGIDMVKEDEYIVQRANFEFLLGIAHGRGIELEIPPGSALLKAAWLYGYEESPLERMESERQDQIERCKQLDDEANELMTQVQKARADYHTHNGALQESKIRLEHLNDLLRGALYGQHGGDTLDPRSDKWPTTQQERDEWRNPNDPNPKLRGR